MNNFARACPSASGARRTTGRRFDRIRSLLGSFAMNLVMRYQRRAAEAELYALDDHLLHDIGIARCQIPMIVDAMLCDQVIGKCRG